MHRRLMLSVAMLLVGAGLLAASARACRWPLLPRASRPETQESAARLSTA